MIDVLNLSDMGYWRSRTHPADSRHGQKPKTSIYSKNKRPESKEKKTKNQTHPDNQEMKASFCWLASSTRDFFFFSVPIESSHAAAVSSSLTGLWLEWTRLASTVDPLPLQSRLLSFRLLIYLSHFFVFVLFVSFVSRCCCCGDASPSSTTRNCQMRLTF